MAEMNYMSLEGIKMPYSLESEQAVLGSILVDPSCLSQASVYLTPDSFYTPQHREIFSAMLYLDDTNKKIDPLVVLNYLVEHDVFDSASGRKYLFDLAQMVPSTENVETYAKIVREKYYIRTLINVSSETIDSAVNQELSADDLLNDAEQKIYDIRQGKTNNSPSLLKDVLVNQVFDTLKKLSGEDKEQYKGYTTGFAELDKTITGLNKSDLIIVGARPAMGKTSFALNLARNVAVLGNRKVLFFSLEMTKEQLAMRVLGSEACVSSQKMREGNISPDEWKRIGVATGKLSECKLYFDDTSSITVPEMKAKARRLGGVECIFIDYLGLIHSSVRAENRVNEISEITRSLKNMAKDLNVPVICCAQLSRVTEARGKSHKPQLADLRDSGSIEQDADIVMMLYREDYYKDDKENSSSYDAEPADGEREANTVSVIVSKNRHGSTGTVDFIWDGEHTLFIGIDKVHDEV
ncbi:MAG: replicative DNA helicase [Clostridia bacterium]|nr:replicative DNA helicase [Clostridia bacterium]